MSNFIETVNETMDCIVSDISYVEHLLNDEYSEQKITEDDCDEAIESFKKYIPIMIANYKKTIEALRNKKNELMADVQYIDYEKENRQLTSEICNVG